MLQTFSCTFVSLSGPRSFWKLQIALSSTVTNEQHRIMAANGTQIIAEPTIALKALSHSNATFSHHDIAKFLHTRTDNADQFQTAFLKVTNCPELVPLGTDDSGRQRFTTRDMLNLERSLLANADDLAHRAGHAVDPKRRTRILAKHTLSPEQERAAIEVTAQGNKMDKDLELRREAPEDDLEL